MLGIWSELSLLRIGVSDQNLLRKFGPISAIWGQKNSEWIWSVLIRFRSEYLPHSKDLNSPAATMWEGYSYIQNSPAATMGKGYSLYPEQSGSHYGKGVIFISRTVWQPLLERYILYIQNSLAATMGKGYSLHPEQSGRHYVKGIFLLGRLQSVFPFA